MALPNNTAKILRYLFPDAEADAWALIDRTGIGIEFTEWNHTEPQPTEQEIIDAGNSTAFSDWLTTPQQVTPYQIRRALSANPADRAAVNALIAGASEAIVDAWESASVIKIDDPLVVGAANQLGWDQAKINSIMQLAATFD